MAYKTNLSKSTTTESTQSVFSDRKGIRLEVNRSVAGTSSNLRKLNSTLLHNPLVKKEVPKNTRKCTRLTESENTTN